MFFELRFLGVFLSTGQSPKKGACPRHLFRLDGLRGSGGEVRRGKLSGYCMDFWTEFSTPAPRYGTANSNAPRIPPSPYWMFGGMERPNSSENQAKIELRGQMEPQWSQNALRKIKFATRKRIWSPIWTPMGPQCGSKRTPRPSSLAQVY